MLDATRAQAAVKARSKPRSYNWGPVDVILAILMLPFAIWMLAIEAMVGLIAGLNKR